MLQITGPLPTTKVCTARQMGKSSKLPFSSSFSISSSPLKLIHSDIWGASPYTLISGVKFYITFIDDFSHYCWIFPLQFKSQGLDVFIEFKALIEKYLNKKIKFLQTDGGGEYTSTAFKSFLTTNGISHHLSCPDTPEQNGLAERKHRHIIETAYGSF